MEARPSYYRGVLMRSRLETAAAAMLDRNLSRSTGMDVWASGALRYEGPAFADQHYNYLPDFTLDTTDHPIYFEVKPGPLTQDERRRILRRMHCIRRTHPMAELALLVGSWLGNGNGYDFVWVPCDLSDPNLMCLDCRPGPRRTLGRLAGS
jgi:hypothetical protein